MMKANPGSVYVESTSSQETLNQTVPNVPITTQYVTISTTNKKLLLYIIKTRINVRQTINQNCLFKLKLI